MRIVGYLLILILAGVAGFASYRWQVAAVAPEQVSQEQVKSSPAVAARSGSGLQGMLRPAFKLPDLDGRRHDVAEWDGKVLVVNFWATWCPPCRKELPQFVALQDKYKAAGLQFVGIAIDDREALQEFLRQVPVNYPMLVSEDEGIAVAKAYGNDIGALPYTVITDRSGRIVYTKPGEFSGPQLEQTITRLLPP